MAKSFLLAAFDHHILAFAVVAKLMMGAQAIFHNHPLLPDCSATTFVLS
jgi:hypothetical protein